MKLSKELKALRLANPVRLEDAAEFATAVKLHERVLELRDDSDERGDQLKLGSASRSRRVRVGGFAAVAAAAALAILLATPAFGRLRDALSFSDAPKAPPAVSLEFSSMNTGAPAGMSPQAVASDTRLVGNFRFGGAVHALWVAPTRTGTFCFEWIDGWGGCAREPNDVLTWNGDLVVPDDAPSLTVPPDATPTQITAFANARHDLAVPTWLSGYVRSGSADSVRITFSDGSTVAPEITWVSAPINAGFFSYDVPSNLRSHADHVTKIDALAADGSVVASQPAH